MYIFFRLRLLVGKLSPSEVMFHKKQMWSQWWKLWVYFATVFFPLLFLLNMKFNMLYLQATDAWGTVDILVNNAGMRYSCFCTYVRFCLSRYNSFLHLLADLWRLQALPGMVCWWEWRDLNGRKSLIWILLVYTFVHR